MLLDKTYREKRRKTIQHSAVKKDLRQNDRHVTVKGKGYEVEKVSDCCDMRRVAHGNTAFG